MDDFDSIPLTDDILISGSGSGITRKINREGSK